MRIGVVVTGGVDRSRRERVVPALLWLVERLARRHDVHVFALHHDRELCTYPLAGATVHDVGRVDGPPGVRRLRLRSKLAAAVDALDRFDVLHAYCGMPAGFIATAVARPRRLPTVVTFDSGELVSLDDIEYGLQRRWIDRRAVAHTVRDADRMTVSTAYMASLARRHGIQPDIIPIGVDVSAFSIRTPVDGRPFRLLRVASLNRVKDYPTLLHAMRSVVDRVPTVHLDIVGEDTLGGAMQALTHTLALDAHVAFHGFQPTDQVAAFYAAAHVNIVSSRHEAANVTVLEAACAGVPTVGTAVGYVADWAPDRAVAVRVGDADALGSAIVDLLHDPDRRARIAASARAWTLAHDADWTAAQFERIYGELVALRT